VLRANGITTRAQLAALAGPHPGADGISPFWRIKGCGKKLAAEIVAWLRRTSAERVMRDFA
jgi:hypothetical protein